MVFPDGGSAESRSSTDESASTEVDGEVRGPERVGTHTIRGTRAGMRVGSGALMMLPTDATSSAELLIGAPGDTLEGAAAGSLAVHAITWDASATYGTEAPVMAGGAGARFGCSARHLPSEDLLAVGACTRSAEHGEQLGAVYLFDEATVRAGGIAWEEAEGRVEGAVEHGGLGRSIASGDMDGDGLTDLILGAPDADGGRGRVYLLHDIAGEPWRSAADTPPLARGTAGDDALGESILLEGDLTGDGHADLLMCAPGWDIAGVPGAGACGVIPGGLELEVLGDLESSVSSIIYGSRLGDAAGDGAMGVQVGPFLDQEGLSVAVALPGADDGAGSILIVGPDDLDGYVSATAATLRINGDGAFGHSMAALPGGGLLVGAPQFGQGGAAFALLPESIWMPSGEAVHASDVSDGIYLGMDPDSGFGTVVAGGRDLDGDLWPDVAIGAPGPSDASTGSVLVAAIPTGWPTKTPARFGG